MSSDPVIELSNVSKRYSKSSTFNHSFREQISGFFREKAERSELREGEFWALRNVTLRINRGECVGLSGPNGSGKSTMLKLISNITYPTLGRVDVHSPIAPLIELGAGFHPDLSGIENIYMNGTILGLSIQDVRSKIDEIVDFSQLGDFVHTPVKKYSSGMTLRLAFSIAINSPAETFLFDEVLAVGDVDFKLKCTEKIKDLKAAGKTIVIVSHDYNEMASICNRIFMFGKGSIKETVTLS